MPDRLKPSEMGGKVQRNRVQPSPHSATASEKLMLTYTTGDAEPTVNSEPDGGEAFAGLLPYDEQLALRTAEGVMEKGQVWKEMLEAGGE